MFDVTVTPISPPKPADYTPAHHVGSPPTSFRNPWPSAGDRKFSLVEGFRTRFFNSKLKNHVPVPADRKGLPTIVTPDWGISSPDNSSMKVTWIGHASFLVEMPLNAESELLGQERRGVRILLDPVFSSNMSPFSFGGPKRISAPPCAIEDLPEIDLVLISHDHYDHLDITTIQFLDKRSNGRIRYLCGLGVATHLMGMGVKQDHIIEMDWWDGATIKVNDIGETNIICTPSQHFSGRWWNDHGTSLWCSWILEHHLKLQPNTSSTTPVPGKKLFFAGDTGYRYKPQSTTPSDHDHLPACPAFKQIGDHHGPFDLALLPIGCYAPRYFMSHIHCAPEDSICIHRDVRSKKSIGMHYGTVRGNISEFYEDSVEPAVLWREECERQGLVWGEDIGLCDIGGTVFV